MKLTPRRKTAGLIIILIVLASLAIGTGANTQTTDDTTESESTNTTNETTAEESYPHNLSRVEYRTILYLNAWRADQGWNELEFNTDAESVAEEITEYQASHKGIQIFSGPKGELPYWTKRSKHNPCDPNKPAAEFVGGVDTDKSTNIQEISIRDHLIDDNMDRFEYEQYDIIGIDVRSQYYSVVVCVSNSSS